MVAIGVTGSIEGAHTIQLFVHNLCLVYQLSQSTVVPNSIKKFLMDPTNFFVCYRSNHFITKLQRSRHQLNMFQSPLDIEQSARMYHDGQALSVEDIARDLLGIHGVMMPMAVDLSDWAVQHLTVEQVKQVVLEAYITYRYTMMIL